MNTCMITNNIVHHVTVSYYDYSQFMQVMHDGSLVSRPCLAFCHLQNIIYVQREPGNEASMMGLCS